jgi:hypothetical protein
VLGLTGCESLFYSIIQMTQETDDLLEHVRDKNDEKKYYIYSRRGLSVTARFTQNMLHVVVISLVGMFMAFYKVRSINGLFRPQQYICLVFYLMVAQVFSCLSGVWSRNYFGCLLFFTLLT